MSDCLVFRFTIRDVLWLTVVVARHWRLSPIDIFWARIVPDVDASGPPSKLITLPLTQEITTPYRHAEMSRPQLNGK
jgi:hypothetical protein